MQSTVTPFGRTLQQAAGCRTQILRANGAVTASADRMQRASCWQFCVSLWNATCFPQFSDA